MDLFTCSTNNISDFAPLADKMRPSKLSEFYGQKHILGTGKMLRVLIEQDQLTSMILQGPPSTGKTSLVNIISQLTNAEFIKLNAVTIGIKDIRDSISAAQENHNLYNKKTIVFIDEIHAMKSNVQMALLPAVETGVIILIGATTESVMHDLIPPLVSRCRVYRLYSLEKEENKEIIELALSDKERGMGDYGSTINEDAMNYLIDVCNGDIRNALSALEIAVRTSGPMGVITLDRVKESYELRINSISTTDFYNLISALIKSMRAGQTDAAVYWLARLLYSGVDPLYIARRIVVHATEDVGMANPQALVVAISTKQAVEFLGMPEARLPLAEAVVYLCESPKSNSVYKAINSALKIVKNTIAYDVPLDLHDKSSTYVNPIDHPATKLEYLPKEVMGIAIYKPKNVGVEAKIYTKHVSSSPYEK